MVISSTRTVAESIQAVSPLFTVGSAAAAAAGAAGAAGAAISANATSKAMKLRQRAYNKPAAIPARLIWSRFLRRTASHFAGKCSARDGILNVMVETPVRDRLRR